MMRMLCVLMSSAAAIFVLTAACPPSPSQAQEASAKIDPSARAEFREPVTLASKDGVLEVRLIAKQGTASLDTVMRPSPHATNMVVKQLGTVASAPGSQLNGLGGD